MLPPDVVVNSTLVVGVVYKIKAPELIKTNLPHYFVVVAIDEGKDSFLIMSTTQLDSRMNYLTKKGYDLNTLAYIVPSENNGLTEDSYFDCNSYHLVSRDNLINKVDNRELEVKGNFTKNEYESIVKSINLSKVNDIPKKLLKMA